MQCSSILTFPRPWYNRLNTVVIPGTFFLGVQMKKEELDYLAQQLLGIKMDQGDWSKQSETIQNLQTWITQQTPKEKSYPYLFCNWNLSYCNRAHISCNRCLGLIFDKEVHFTLDLGPDNVGNRYERFCVDCATEEEKQHKGYKQYDPNKSFNVKRLMLECITKNPGITENQLLEKLHIGLPLLKKVVTSLLVDMKVEIKRGSHNSKMHFIMIRQQAKETIN